MENQYQFDFSNTLMETLDMEITEFTREKVVVSMPVTGKTMQPFGRLHGGVSVALAETAASAGSYLFLDPSRQSAVGLEINANHLRSVAAGMVQAVAKPVHVGRHTLVWDVRIYDEQERLFCISRCTVAIIDRSSGA